MVATILYLGYNEKFNLWLGPLQTIAGLAVFVTVIVLSQLIYSTIRIKSKIVTMVFFDGILSVLLIFLFVNLSEWTNLSEDIFGYIALVLSILISLVLGLDYHRKHHNHEITDFKNEITLHTLLISTAFSLLFLISYFMSYKLSLLPNKESGLFTGLGILMSLYIGIAICLWSLGPFLLVRIYK